MTKRVPAETKGGATGQRAIYLTMSGTRLDSITQAPEPPPEHTPFYPANWSRTKRLLTTACLAVALSGMLLMGVAAAMLWAEVWAELETARQRVTMLGLTFGLVGAVALLVASALDI